MARVVPDDGHAACRDVLPACHHDDAALRLVVADVAATDAAVRDSAP